ncbi:MAG TPA: acetyl-CoA hydrolase/transferase C-terminal domain-containing protein [Bryobacteraceae bacterium]|nr:acetyl-CoA hydrolase/transferase C-terminal domain-containing protein [Bryobacteraceae bacterium]
MGPRSNDYRSRIVSADEAVKRVQSGHRVYIHNGCAEPTELVEALTRRGQQLEDVEMLQMATMGVADYSLPEYQRHFRPNALFIGANVRRAVQEGRGDYTPIFLSEIEGLFTSGALPVDVALLQCAPPDAHGFMSLGVAVDVSLTVAEHARCVLVEINDRMPRTMGDSFLHVSRVDAFVETSHPLAEYPQHEVTECHCAIARRIAGLIPDGATIQTGIGGIPEATLAQLKDHKDLGIHSEMVPDGAIDLITNGVVTGDRKTLHRGKVVSGFVLGSQRLFDFLDDNPIFEFHRTAYCNNPMVVAQNDRMVAINAAIEIDLTGQVCSDSMGRLPYSGIGGQIDFLRGAAMARDGVPIIALPSTARNGTVSRITTALQPGAGVVTSRGDVHYVVTEHGVAYLHGKTLCQRAEALIQIAHPKFRDELERFAVEQKLLRAARSKVFA